MLSRDSSFIDIIQGLNDTVAFIIQSDQLSHYENTIRKIVGQCNIYTLKKFSGMNI